MGAVSRNQGSHQAVHTARPAARHPAFIFISDGKLHDVNVLDILLPEPGAFHVMDRSYLDFARLYTLHQAGAFFVTRAKSNFKYKRIYSSYAVDRTSGLICNQLVELTVFYSLP